MLLKIEIINYIIYMHIGISMKKRLIEYIGRIQEGGAEALVKDYALLLDKEKFNVIVLCDDVRNGSANYKILIDNNIKVVSLFGNHRFICRVLRRVFGGRFRALLFDKKIKELKPDIIHAHLESLETLRYSKQLDGIKLFYTCHNPPEMMIGSGNIKEHQAAEYLLKKYRMRFIALHNEMAEEINIMFSIDNCAVIRNAIDFDRFANLNANREEVRKTLNIPNDAYVVGNNGRFVYQKNHEFLINVFSKINSINKNSYLLLIGRGTLEEDIKKQISELGLNDNIRILSNRSDVPELLNAMDVFVFPSRFEGLGISLIEAQIMKLPCVVSQAIPSEAIQSNLITKLSLNDSLDLWVDQCLNPISNVKEFGNIENYNMKKEIKHLENLYLD